jgi:hypothetical protein
MTMATTGAPRSGREHGGVSPILIVGGLAIVAFVVAVLAFRGGSGSSQNVSSGGQTAATADPASPGECGQGNPDPTYTVAMDSDPTPPRSQGATFHLTVRHNGTAVTGAKVCLAAEMPTMQHAGITKVAKEASGGRYDADLKFSMEGSWAATVTIAEPGKPVVSAPVVIEVAS